MSSFYYITSKSIWVFPCANRSVNIESKLMTEANFVHIPSIAGAKNYVAPKKEGSDYIECVIGGYYVKFLETAISSEETDGNDLYAHLALAKKDLYTADGTTSGTDATTEVIGSYSTANSAITVVNSLDITPSGSAEANFTGIYFNNTDEAPTLASSDGQRFETLQILSKGKVLYSAPIDTDSLQTEAVTANKLGNIVRNVTYSELIALRDSGSLMSGCQYRITDYECTTTQSETTAAENKFDIILTADEPDRLDENAKAAHQDGDSYFADSNVEA